MAAKREERTVVILGLARQGKALARYWSNQGWQVIVSDIRSETELAEACQELSGRDIGFVLGGHPESLLESANRLYVSGGVPADLPLVQLARRADILVSNDAQLFLELCPAPVIGITGSAGKTTTTTLVGRMAEYDSQQDQTTTWVGGNIGRSLLDDLDSIQADDNVVMELSSFQLEIMTLSPRIAAILNVTPNHLDRHITMAAYSEAKANILKHQSRDDLAILGRDDSGAWELRWLVQGEYLSFGWDSNFEGDGTWLQDDSVWLRRKGHSQELFPVESVLLRGRHNLLNVLAACAIASAVELTPEAMRAGVRDFKGVPHRLEWVRTIDGVQWFNDSIATAPERALAAVEAFDEPIVLLAGGRDKDLDWSELVIKMADRVRVALLFGEAQSKIEKTIKKVWGDDPPYMVRRCKSLDEAVSQAAELVQSGEVVLLAPGGTSFDAYVDFAQRGQQFRELVEAL
jgi:UDP-N-acetylmuramoylalanine--D-glutamate ligase